MKPNFLPEYELPELVELNGIECITVEFKNEENGYTALAKANFEIESEFDGDDENTPRTTTSKVEMYKCDAWVYDKIGFEVEDLEAYSQIEKLLKYHYEH